MILTLLLAACGGIHQNRATTGVEQQLAPSRCALVATAGSPVYSRPVASVGYRVATLNWGAFPLVQSDLLLPGGEWMAIAMDIGGHHIVAFVKASNMTFDVATSTMSPGDAEETDWSKCTNAPVAYR